MGSSPRLALIAPHSGTCTARSFRLGPIISYGGVLQNGNARLAIPKRSCPAAVDTAQPVGATTRDAHRGADGHVTPAEIVADCPVSGSGFRDLRGQSFPQRSHQQRIGSAGAHLRRQYATVTMASDSADVPRGFLAEENFATSSTPGEEPDRPGRRRLCRAKGVARRGRAYVAAHEAKGERFISRMWSSICSARGAQGSPIPETPCGADSTTTSRPYHRFGERVHSPDRRADDRCGHALDSRVGARFDNA